MRNQKRGAESCPHSFLNDPEARVPSVTDSGERNDASAKPAAGEAGAVHAGRPARDLREPIDLRQRDFEVVAHRRVRRVEQAARPGEIRRTEGRNSLHDAVVLGDHVARAVRERTGLDLCGEAGEYHTLVTDGPQFSQTIQIGSCWKRTAGSLAYMEIHDVKLAAK